MHYALQETIYYVQYAISNSFYFDKRWEEPPRFIKTFLTKQKYNRDRIQRAKRYKLRYNVPQKYKITALTIVYLWWWHVH